MAYLLLLLLLLAGVALLGLQRWRELAAGRRRLPATLRERTLFDLQPGDIVQAEARDWAVEDRLVYEDDGFQWLEYPLRDGADHRWLVVCEDDWLEVDWLEVVTFRPPLPLPETLDWQGRTYSLQEQGVAWVSRREAAMNRRLGTCRYADYGAAEQRRLCVELWGRGLDDADDDDSPGEIEVTAGRRVDPLSLTLLPGDGRPVYR